MKLNLNWEALHFIEEKPTPKNSRNGTTTIQTDKKNVSKCRRNVLYQMTQGIWRKRASVTLIEEINREQMDIHIRKERRLPIVLHRSDMRCGTNFKLAGNIASQCDENSSAPCCNNDKGRCGSGTEFCSCKNCIDFRKQISAELFEYIPSSGCMFKNFTSKETCDFLNNRISNLTFMGDSIIRHFFNALMVLITNDAKEGALRQGITDDAKKTCSYDLQFVDSAKSNCAGKIAMTSQGIPAHKVCQGRFNNSVKCIPAYNLGRAGMALNVIRENLNKSKSVVVVGVGLHMNLDFNAVKSRYMDPIIQLKKNSRSEWPLIIWATGHTQGTLKPVQYLKTQNNDRIMEYNRQMKEYLQPHRIPVFDVFNLTVGIKSYDGTHYGFGVNMVKAQLLMNFLEEKFEQ